MFLKLAKVKLLGSLAKLPSGARLSQETLEGNVPVSRVISLLKEKHNLEVKRESVLILVNGIEVRALEDLQTVVGDRDEVVLIPMYHGGA
jgi:molybdopterin converting factor small subunit